MERGRRDDPLIKKLLFITINMPYSTLAMTVHEGNNKAKRGNGKN